MFELASSPGLGVSSPRLGNTNPSQTEHFPKRLSDTWSRPSSDSPVKQSEARTEIIIDGTSSEQSAFAFLASQQSSVRNLNNTRRSSFKVGPGPGFASNGLPQLPKKLPHFNRLLRTGRKATYSPNSINALQFQNTFEDSPTAKEDNREFGSLAEGDGAFCGVTFDTPCQPASASRRMSIKREDPVPLQMLLRQCKQAFLISDLSRTIERTLIASVLLFGSWNCLPSWRALACFICGVVGLAAEGLMINHNCSHKQGQIRSNSDSPREGDLFSRMSGAIKHALRPLGRHESLSDNHLVLMSVALAAMPASCPAVSAAFIGYLFLLKIGRRTSSSSLIHGLIIIFLLRILADCISRAGPSEADPFVFNLLCIPLLLVSWIAAERLTTTNDHRAAELEEENRSLHESVASLTNNQRSLFIESEDAMIICQVNNSKLNRQPPTKISRVVSVSQGFRKLFGELSLPSAFSKRVLEPVTQTGRKLSIQAAIIKALAHDRILYNASFPGFGQAQIIYLEASSICFNNEEAVLVQIRQVSDVIEQQTQRIQGVFQEALISTIQHEQLNPLNSIINLSTLMKDYFADKVSFLAENALHSSSGSDVPAPELEEAEQTLQWTKIIRSSSIMMQLLNAAILNQGQIDSGKFKPTYDVVKDPLDIVAKLTDLFDEHAKSQQLAVEVTSSFKGSSAQKSLLTSRGMMMEVALYEQILFNILVNAFKFNKPGGSVSVNLELRMNERSTIEALTTISDSGTGMTNAKQQNLGKMFESICIRESTIQPQPEQERQATSGVGLGFTLSKKLTEFLGGSILVSSELNAGTEVRVRLQFPLGPRSSSALSNVSHTSLHSIEILKSSQYVNLPPKTKGQSPEQKLSSIALTFKQRRNSLKSSSNLKYQATSNLAIFRGQDESPSKTKNERSLLSKVPNSASQLRSCDSGLNDFSSQQASNSADLKREFSFANSSGYVDNKIFKKLAMTRKTNLESPNPSFLESIQSLISVSEQGSDDCNFDNLTDQSSPSLIVSRALSTQQEFEPLIKTKASLNCLGHHHQGLLTADYAFSTPVHREDREKYSTSNQNESRPQQSTLSEHSDSNSDEVGFTHKPSRASFEGCQLEIKGLPQLQQIQEDFEEDKGSVLGKTRGDKGRVRILRKSRELSGRLSSQGKSISSQNEEEKSEEDKKSLHHELASAEQAARFRLFTPQSKPKESGFRLRLRKEPPKNCSSPVLLVDDSHFNIATLEVMISVKFSTKCLIARNGRQAVDLVKQLYVPPGAGACPHCSRLCCEFRGVRLVFMDLNMPVMDGFEAAEKILAFQGEDRRCSVVALTAFQDPKTREKCLAVGMKEVLAKPASQELIGRTIKKYCGLEERKKSIK